MILLDESTDAGYFANALNGVELITDIPVLHRTQLLEIEPLPLKRVPIDLAQSRSVRTQHRRDA